MLVQRPQQRLGNRYSAEQLEERAKAKREKEEKEKIIKDGLEAIKKERADQAMLFVGSESTERGDVLVRRDGKVVPAAEVELTSRPAARRAWADRRSFFWTAKKRALRPPFLVM
jgi:hypothetical protein